MFDLQGKKIEIVNGSTKVAWTSKNSHIRKRIKEASRRIMEKNDQLYKDLANT